MRSASSEAIECPLCCGAGELTRAEILDRLGVRDFARIAQLSAEEAFRLLQQKHSKLRCPDRLPCGVGRHEPTIPQRLRPAARIHALASNRLWHPTTTL